MEFKDISTIIADVASRYHYHKPPQFLIILQEMLSRVLRFLKDLFEQLHLFNSGFSDTRMVGNLMQILLYVVGSICALTIIYLVFSRMTKLTQMSRLARAGAMDSERLLTSEGWMNEAKQLASEQHFKSACRAAYLSFLRLLDEKKVAPYAPAKTNYEYWYQLSASRELQVNFRKLADIVELVWFGNKPAERGDFDRCLELIDATQPIIEKLAEEKQNLQNMQNTQKQSGIAS